MSRNGSRDTAARPEKDVITWRAQQLVAAGFDLELARQVAADRRWDLHRLLELVDRGCPPQLAARIVSPLDV